MAENTTKTEETVPEIIEEGKKGLERSLVLAGIGVFLVLALASTAIYLIVNHGRVYVDKAQVTAPVINLAPTTSGTLQAVYVSAGDIVPANTPVAQVGNEIVKTTVAGLIVSTNTNIGALTSPGTSVASMIDPSALRVVGQVDENKGLADIAVGDRVAFTVDAFGSKEYQAVVDEISPTAHAGDIVFSISDKRPTQSFDVKARFDISAYPELKNGMSARMWIYQ